MSISLSTLLSIVGSRYNSATNDPFFTDEYLRGLVFEAESILAKEGWVIEDTLTTTSVSGTRELNYPSNTLAIKEIRYDYKKLSLTEMTFDPKTSSTDPSGTPRRYGVWDDIIYLFPTPSVSGNQIQIRRYAYPAFLTSNICPLNVPTEYQTDLINFILGHMATKDQNLPLAQTYFALWAQTVAKARDQRRKRLRKDKMARTKDLYFGSDEVTADGGAYGFYLP